MVVCPESLLVLQWQGYISSLPSQGWSGRARSPPRQDAVRLSVLRPPFSPALFSGVPLDKGGWNKTVESALVAPGGTTWVERIWTNRHFPLILLGLFIPVA